MATPSRYCVTLHDRCAASHRHRILLQPPRNELSTSVSRLIGKTTRFRASPDDTGKPTQARPTCTRMHHVSLHRLQLCRCLHRHCTRDRTDVVPMQLIRKRIYNVTDGYSLEQQKSNFRRSLHEIGHRKKMMTL